MLQHKHSSQSEAPNFAKSINQPEVPYPDPVTSLLPGLIYYPPCPPELAKPGLKPPIAR